MALQFQTQGGVKKLLKHDSATNPQAVGDLQGECCCLGYVRLTQCIDTGFKCGNCPDSGTESGCDEDGDGSEDYANVIYIDEGIWEEKAKYFQPSDCVGGGTWFSLTKNGAVLVTTGSCAGYQSAGTVASLPATCQNNIRSLDMFKEFEGDQVPPGIPANPGGSGAKNLINYANCLAACEDDYYEVTACEDGQCGFATSELQCPEDGKKYYIPCGMLEDFFGAGQVDNNIGKVIKLNNDIDGPCVKLTNTRVCGAFLPYDCVSGTWTKGAIDGENRIASDIIGTASDDCCTCQAVTCSCARACADDLSSTYTISVNNINTNGKPYQCSCNNPSNNFYGLACDEDSNLNGGSFSGVPSGGCEFLGSNCCQQEGVCQIPSSLGSVSVERPQNDGRPSCYTGVFTSDGFSMNSPGDVFDRSGCGTGSDGTGSELSPTNKPCRDLSGPYMTTKVVAFKCNTCGSGQCNCPQCSNPCPNQNQCAPSSDVAPGCFDIDADNDDDFDCVACESNYEDDFFLFAAALYCPVALGGQTPGSLTKWRVEVGIVAPGTGPSLHGVLRTNENREFASTAGMVTLTARYEKTDNSEDPAGTYNFLSVSPSLGGIASCFTFDTGNFNFVNCFEGSTVSVG